jgi:hypothetical protein
MRSIHNIQQDKKNLTSGNVKQVLTVTLDFALICFCRTFRLRQVGWKFEST